MLGGRGHPVSAAVQAAGRAEDFASRRDVGRYDTVLTPQCLGLVEVVDDRHLREEMMDQVRRIRADAPGHPAAAIVVRPRPAGDWQVLERQEGRGPQAVVAEI